MMRLIAGIVYSSAAALLTGCNPPAQDGATQPAATQAANSAPVATATTDLTPAQRAYSQANERMHAGMAAAIPADPDVAFAQGMIPHHQGAIDMARVQLQYGKDPEMRKLAQDVIAAQEEEIAQLRAFLAKRGAQGTGTAPAAPVDHSAMGH